MGVSSLWEVLESAKEGTVNLDELSGKKLAVDLSLWIVKLGQIKVAKEGYSNVFIRNLFFRILEFMKAGISLVFVLDGQAPALKQPVMEARQTSQFGGTSAVNPDRPVFSQSVEKCVRLLECLGLPYIRSDGEAEALCASLDKQGLVDGCITEDGDVLCYGARTVYRKLQREGKIYTLDEYSMKSIKEELHLDQKSLIAFALLVGSDYDKSGIKFIGKEKAMKVINEIQAKGECPLDRVCSWPSNNKLEEITKENHCSLCGHTGTRTDHSQTGCGICKTKEKCNQSNDVQCSCEWHSHKVEIDVRKKAVENKSFPNKEIVDEFLKENVSGKITPSDLGEKEPELSNLVSYMQRTLYWSGDKVMEKMAEVFIHQLLLGKQFSAKLQYTPERILRTCKVDRVAYYEVEYAIPVGDQWSKERKFKVKLKQTLFNEKYPELHRRFREETPQKSKTVKGQKRKDTKDSKQPTLMAVMALKKVKRSLFQPSEGCDAGNPSSSDAHVVDISSDSDG